LLTKKSLPRCVVADLSGVMKTLRGRPSASLTPCSLVFMLRLVRPIG
jgi:hypothetical protein